MPYKWSIESYETLPSTQDKLKYELESNPYLPEGFVVHAKNQTDGYGRHGRSWKGGEGSIYLSFLLRPKQDHIKAAQLSLIAGLALTETIKIFLDNHENIILKWPNDVLINGKKCAGILIESVHNNDSEYPAFVVGVGVNIIDCQFENSTFLNAHANTTISTDTFRSNLLDRFADYYSEWKKQGFNLFRDRFIRQTYAKGTQIGVKVGSQKITGKFKNIDSHGNLELLCDEKQKIRKITSGDVFLV